MTITIPEPPIPVTCFTGFLGAGKTSTILGLLTQLPKDYKVVLLKNEYGDVEVDSLLASQCQITGVSEILNGCLCCTMVGLVENALMEIKETMKPDRIIIESSGSAFPATLALQIRELEPKGFKLDGVVTVIDCVNFRGYEDKSPSAKLQAQYTDLLLLSKHSLVSEREYDDLLDHLLTLNDETPYIKVGPENPVNPELIFGLDTKLFLRVEEEGVDWTAMGGNGAKGSHSDEVETKTIWRGGSKPGNKGKGKEREHLHNHDQDCGCESDDDEMEAMESEVRPIDRSSLEGELAKLSFEVYRVKGIIRLQSPKSGSGWSTYILNYAFGRHELTPCPSLDDSDDLKGVSLRLTVMGERGEVTRRARKLAEGLEASVG